MSTSLEQLMRGIQTAVVQASHRMRDEQGRLIREFFDPVEVPVGDTDGASQPRTVTRYEPKLARFALPVEDGDGRRVKDIWVPLISMVPQSSLVIDEVRIVTEIELTVEEGEAVRDAAMPMGETASGPPPARLLARSPGGSHKDRAAAMAATDGAAPTGTSKTLVEIRLKADPQASGLDEFLAAYNDALRKQLP